MTSIKNEKKENIDKEHLLEEINEAKKKISETMPQNLKESIFQLMDTLSKVLLAYRDNKGTPGWTKSIRDSNDGSPLFSNDEQQQIETIFQQTFGNYESFQQIQKQNGGGSSGLSDQLTKMRAEQYKSLINEDDISLDKLRNTIGTHFQGINDSFNEIAKIVGPVAFVEKVPTVSIGPTPPYIPAKIDIPTRPILPFITTILETMRLAVTYGPVQIDFLRIVYSIVLSIYDLSRGNWKQSFMSLMGAFQKDWVWYGFLFKLIISVYNLIEPSVQGQLQDAVYSSSKSALLGIWITVLDLVATPEIREQISLFMKKSEGIRNPQILCRIETQQLLEPLLEKPVFRIALEFMNIPTQPEDIAKRCGLFKQIESKQQGGNTKTHHCPHCNVSLSKIVNH